jgi:hypothetical protein
VELQKIERHRIQDRAYVGNLRIDEQADLGHERRQRVGDFTRAADFDHARRAAPEIEADRVGAGVACGKPVGHARDAADLDAGACIFTRARRRGDGGRQPKRASNRAGEVEAIGGKVGAARVRRARPANPRSNREALPAPTRRSAPRRCCGSCDGNALAEKSKRTKGLRARSQAAQAS